MAEQSCCPAGLIELKNDLARELKDEITASSRYREAAGKFTHYRLPDFAKTLGSMSEDEFTHWINLVTIVEALNEICKCGKEEIKLSGKMVEVPIERR